LLLEPGLAGRKLGFRIKRRVFFHSHSRIKKLLS
jgi:hypothetical protein